MHKELSEVSGLTTEEKRTLAARLLRARGVLKRRASACLHRLFEAQAAIAPGAIALTCEDRNMSYGELNARANRLARRLRALGIGPESPVGLYVDRSIEMVVGLLGVLKAGGVYVPLDTAYPAERLAFLLADSKVPVLLTRSHLLDKLPAHGAETIDLDDECLSLREDDLEGGAEPENAAYVIYTSGSTGQPKGVVVTHANVTHLMAATQDWYDFGSGDVWTLFHSFAFDFSVWEIWGALTFGGRLVVVPYWASRSPEAFHALLRSERVSVLNQTPSAFRQLIRADEAAGKEADDLSLRLVIFGGEALEPETLRPWFERHGDAVPELVNMYGITETTVHVTYRPVTSADLGTSSGSSPIGVPIPGWKVLLLDRLMQPVPVGVVGEIFVGGPGLARGYLNRPALTAERFVADPFSAGRGGRLYKSGDLARRRADGSLEYVGRSDDQVKIRGFRIELGEIEAALLKHPSLREAVVLPRDYGAEDRRLVAYVVGRSEGTLGASDLRRWLKPRLPEYMIPATFVTLERLPLTPHGKIDREALPAPEAAIVDDSRSAYEAPLTPAESLVAAAWADVFGVDRVGRRDDFFELGGHSLLATQVVSRIRETFDVDVPLRWLFEAPTVAGLAERVEERKRGELGYEASPILRIDRDQPAPLSHAQEALWFLEQLDPGRATFNVSVAVRIEGPLQVAALERAFREIVRRHESLRTNFEARREGPVQIVGPASEAAFEEIDLTDLSEQERAGEAQRRAMEESRRPFDLVRGALARVAVLKLAETEHAVLLTMHHIVTDGWSLGVAAKELTTLYEAFTNGHESPLAELPIRYSDYAFWQRERLRGDVLDGLLGYWTGRLAGVPALELPTDRPRPAMRTARGEMRGFRVPAATASAIRLQGRREGTTPFMTLLAAFQVLLSRYTGQEDFAVGSPVANRNRAEVEGLIGYFINMLVLRADLSGDPSFRELLKRVRGESLGAYDHQDLPLERLVEALQPVRDPSRTPLFQVMFVFQNTEIPDVSRSELTLTPMDLGEGNGTAKFDLTLAMADDGPEMAGSFEYDADLFDASTIERMISHLLKLLEEVSVDASRRISTIPILRVEEREQLLVGWNQTEVAIPVDARVHQLFEAQARRTPDAVAVEGETEKLTYAELDRRANKVAHYLRASGVSADVRVGIALERIPEMAVGLLAILKAGGAYVPLDPSYPSERLAYMIEDSGLAVLLTQTKLKNNFPEFGGEVLALDSGAFDEEFETRPEILVGAGDAAYVIYTSGSTGQPRGAIVTHGGLANHAIAAAEMFGIEGKDRVLQFASLSFDITVEELFPAWSRGATVVLRGGDETLEPRLFSRWVDAHRISVLDLPTAYWHAWISEIAAQEGVLPDSLRLVVVGGERALPTVYGKWRGLAGERVRWINTYGPTETTVIATAFEPGPGEDVVDLPIGRPIANTRVYVLDPSMEPVPAGVSGELYIGGAGVGKGYLGQAELTAERFVDDPFSGGGVSRLFKTGDRVRWRSDGQLDFLGRYDEQVKIRGYRVEPSEVEAALRAHPGVREAVVVAGFDAFDVGRLDAYVVPERGGSAPGDELRRFLRETLPRPLIPSTFTSLNTLPMTPSGKVDRRALPAPGAGSDFRSDAMVEARDELEGRLVGVWEEVLEVRPVGVTDSFFELGGHSLLAIRLLGRVEEEFGRRLALASLFVGPTVEDMASLLRRAATASRSEAWSPLVAIQAEGTRAPFFCVHPAGGVVYCFEELARTLGKDRPFYAFQSAGLDGEREPIGGLEEMARTYVTAMRGVQPIGPYQLGGWSLGGVVAFEMARQLREAGESVSTLALIDSHVPKGAGEAVPEALLAIAREVSSLELLGSREESVDELDALILAEFAGDLAHEYGGARALIRHLRRLEAGERRGFLLKAFGLDSVYYMDTGADQIARLWDVLRANLKAVARYEPKPYAGRVMLFRARDERGKAGTSESLGWDELLAGGVTTRVVPGDHEGILKMPGVAVLAEGLRAELDRNARGTS